MNWRRTALWLHILTWAIFAPRSAAAAPTSDSLRQRLDLLDCRSVLVFANQIAEENHEVALFAFDIALQKASRPEVCNSDPTLLFSVFRDKGVFWEDRNQLDSAATLYRRALESAEKHGLYAEARSILNDLAIVSRKREEYPAARDYHLDALKRAQAAGDDELVEFTLHGLGYLYDMVGDREMALKYYGQSLDYAEKRGHKNGMMVSLGNLAEVLAANRQEAKALEHAQRGLKLALAERDTEQIALLYFILGDICEQFGQAEKAVKFFEKSIPWTRVAREWTLETEILIRLGALAEKQGELARAELLFKACFVHADLLPAKLLAEAYLRLGQVAVQTGKRDEALPFFQKSYGIARTNQLPEPEIAAAQALYQWFEAQKRPAEALAFLERANTLHDSLSNVLRQRGSAELAFRYDLEKMGRDLDALKVRQNRLRTGAVLLVGLIVAMALGFIVYSRRKTNATLKAKNEAIWAQNARLEESNKFLYQFTYAVAHDMKEPMRTVSSFITLLERKHGKEFTGEGLEYMKFVQQGVARMNNLVADLLAFSKISSQRRGDENVDAKTVLDQLIPQMREDIHARNGGVQYAENFPAVRMNPAHLRCLLQNLIHNGLKFNNNEHPQVKIEAHHVNGHVHFLVEDNGIGIDQAYHKKIFDLFHQLHKNKPYGGTGIGLTVVKNIVDKYDGKIWLEAAGEQGTRFWVSLPSAN